jgi:hypothetical protein
MAIIKRTTTHYEIENGDTKLTGDKVVSKLFGVSLKSAFNAAITDKDTGKFLMFLSHVSSAFNANGMSVKDGSAYQDRIVETYSKNGVERTDGGTAFRLP